MFQLLNQRPAHVMSQFQKQAPKGQSPLHYQLQLISPHVQHLMAAKIIYKPCHQSREYGRHCALLESAQQYPLSQKASQQSCLCPHHPIESQPQPHLPWGNP